MTWSLCLHRKCIFSLSEKYFIQSDKSVSLTCFDDIYICNVHCPELSIVSMRDGRLAAIHSTTVLTLSQVRETIVKELDRERPQSTIVPRNHRFLLIGCIAVGLLLASEIDNMLSKVERNSLVRPEDAANLFTRPQHCSYSVSAFAGARWSSYQLR